MTTPPPRPSRRLWSAATVTKLDSRPEVTAYSGDLWPVPKSR